MKKNDQKPVLGMILKGYPRISETFISNELLLLERLGFKIHIFSMRHPREPFCHDSVKLIKAEVDYLPQTISGALPQLIFHNVMQAAEAPGRYWTGIKTAFRRFLRTRKSATIKHLLQAGYLTHKLLPGSGVVHLHSHFAHSPTSVAMFSSMLSGLEFSFTGHAKDIYTSDVRQLREKIDLAKFAATCTEYNKRYLSTISAGSTTPLHRVYHGIDTLLFSNQGLKEAPSNSYNILTIARIVEKKGLPTVYRALAILRDKGIGFKHTLIGDGDDEKKITALIKELNLGSHCACIGTHPHHVVLGHYKESDLFVLGCEYAANGDRDGIPNVFVEGMAMGVPVVATNVSAIPELVENEKTGLVVEPGNPEALAQAMERLLTDMKLREKVIPAARAKVERDFDNSKLISDLSKIYLNEQPLLKAG